MMTNDWLFSTIEEYKTLRSESLESIKGQQSTLRIGIVTVGVVVAMGFNVWDKTLLPEIVFLAFVPLICYLILVIWIGEVARMMRAGYYISLIEKKVKAFFGSEPPPIFWENWLRTKDAKEKNTPNEIKLFRNNCTIFLHSNCVNNYWQLFNLG